MKSNKSDILKEQADIIKSVIKTLEDNINSEQISDEINFLSIVEANLNDLANTINNK